MPIIGLDRMPGSGLARGTLFDKELNVTTIDVPTLTVQSSIILEKSAENKYTITWTSPSGDDRALTIPQLGADDQFTFNTATQTLTNKNITVTALDAAAADLTIFNTVGANTLTIGAGNTTVTIAGNLTVSGTTTTVNSNTVSIADALILLNRDESGTPSHDSGYIIERGSSTNVGLIWDESADEWATINTSSTGTEEGNVTIASYANFQAAGVAASSIALGGKLTAGSNEIEGSAFDIDGGDISAVTISGGLTWSSAQNLNSQALTNVNIDSGDISAATISGDLTWSSNQDMGTINLQTGGKLTMDIDSGATINSSGGGVDGAGSITLGAGQDAGLYVSSDDLYIENRTSDKDIIFRGNDGGTFTTLMTIDASDATVTLPAATITTVDINGGAIDAVTIGTNSAVTELQVDNININGNTITSTDSNGDITLTPNGTGEVNIAAGNLNYAGTAVVTTGAELNILDGGTSATGTTLVAADRVVVNDAGTMVQVAMSDFETFMESNLDTLNSVTSASSLATVGALNAGSITSGFGAIDNGSSAITTTGTITGGAVTVDDISLNGKVLTMTGSTSDTVTMTAATNGAFSLVTVDDAAAAANIQITADGTVDIDSAGVLTLDSGAAINIEPAAGSAILLDGTISIDGGAVTGVATITMSGELDAGSLDISGDADIDGTLEADAITVDGTALNEYIADTVGAMVSGNTEGNITVTYQDSDNTLDFDVSTTASVASTVTVVDSTDTSSYITMVDSATGDLAVKTDGGLTYNAGTGILTATGFAGPLVGNVTGNASGTALTVTQAAQSAITSLGTLTTLTVDSIIVNGTTIGHTSDTDLITLADGNVTIAGELDLTTLDVSGNADIDGTLEADAITIDGTALNEYIADTIGAMVTSNTESGITVAYQDGDNTLDFTVGTLNQDTTGTAAIATTVTITDNESTNEDNAIVFTSGGDVDGGNIGLESDGDLIYNPSTGRLTATQLAGTLQTAAQTNITSLGTLTTLTVDDIIINGANIGHTSDTDAIAIASNGVVTMNQIPVFSAGINVSGGTIAGTLATVAQTNITSLGTLTALQVDNININGNTISSTDSNGAVTLDPNGTGDIRLWAGGKVDIDKANDVDPIHIVNSGDSTRGTSITWTARNQSDSAITMYQAYDGHNKVMHFGPNNISNESISSPTISIDATNGRVGIGAGSPSYQLEVAAIGTGSNLSLTAVGNLSLDANDSSAGTINLKKGGTTYGVLTSNAQNDTRLAPTGEFDVHKAGAMYARIMDTSNSVTTTIGADGSGDDFGMVGTSTADDFQIWAGNAARIYIDNGGQVGIGVSHSGDTYAYATLAVKKVADTVLSLDRVAADGSASNGGMIRFYSGGSEIGIIDNQSGTLSYGTFTGSHLALTEESIEFGELVTMTGTNGRWHDDADAEILYGVVKSTTANDPKLLGTYLGVAEPKNAASVDNPHLIACVGNGPMWLVDKGANIAVGDYLISSDVAGHAMKDDGTNAVSYVIGRATEAIDWSTVSDTVGSTKHKKITVTYESFKNLEGRLAALEARVTALE